MNQFIMIAVCFFSVGIQSYDLHERLLGCGCGGGGVPQVNNELPPDQIRVEENN